MKTKPAMKKQQNRMIAAGKAWKKLSANERAKRKWTTFAKSYLKGKC